MTRVVITDATFPDVAKEEAAARAAGASFERHACKTAEDVAAALKGADVAVVQFAPLTREAVAGLVPGATAIRYGVGYNNFDVAALNDHAIKAAYVPDYCTAEVADHTAASLLSLLRKLPALDGSVRRGEWAAVGIAKPLKSFAETTIGFLGFGRIAQEVAARLAPFGFHFLAHDPYFTGSFPRLTLTDLPTLLAQSDALTLHAPATPETTGIINAANLRRMKSTAVLVNTARGDLIDEPALAAALTSGTIAGAALDVFLIEPLPADNPLRHAPNLLLGPHAAWYSEVAVERLQSLVADEITRALTGRGVRKAIPGSTA
ncbi:C-terminal binding protein [Tabrizicola sp.]|uniref:C-terminal binding protein n=1 Tax=Tabrizicola sp. TaxID=2005166 RepID=UPI00286B4C7E|nr:C-terminal binding protein [Tabrizicola sp.]